MCKPASLLFLVSTLLLAGCGAALDSAGLGDKETQSPCVQPAPPLDNTAMRTSNEGGGS